MVPKNEQDSHRIGSLLDEGTGCADGEKLSVEEEKVLRMLYGLVERDDDVPLDNPNITSKNAERIREMEQEALRTLLLREQKR